MIKIANISEIPIGGSKVVMHDETPVALFNINGKIIAWDNRCPHRGASLADGNINNDTVQCKYHLWEFDFKRACSTANENIKVKKFKISLIGNDIFIC